jgi:hypothetical protein
MQRRRECDERARRRRLAQMRAMLPEEKLKALRIAPKRNCRGTGRHAHISGTTCW